MILLLYLLLTCAGSSSFHIFSSALKDSTLAPFLAFMRTKWHKWRFENVMDYIVQELLLDLLILRRKQFKLFKEVWLFYIQVFFYIKIVQWIYLIGIVVTIFFISKRFFQHYMQSFFNLNFSTYLLKQEILDIRKAISRIFQQHMLTGGMLTIK